VGTLSQALKAGIPQIVRPYGFDQFDNAARLVRLGVAREISVKAYTSDNIAKQLAAIVSDHKIKRRCVEISSRMADPNPIAKTCDLLLDESRTFL
jgi:UDP:flavonoid glycosyltransferase YjiC (YdhE family)